MYVCIIIIHELFIYYADLAHKLHRYNSGKCVESELNFTHRHKHRQFEERGRFKRNSNARDL